MKKKISQKALTDILNKMPAHIKEKIVAAMKEGKKVNIKLRKNENSIKSPYQGEE